MDLKCSLPGMAGKRHWESGYEIPIGMDSIARNVPSEAAQVMIEKDPTIWQRLVNGAPPLKGMVGGASVSQAVRIEKVEVPLVPHSLAVLEDQKIETLLQVMHEFGLTPEEHDLSVHDAARAVLAAADEQLSMQLLHLIDDAKARTEASKPPAQTTPVATESAPAPSSPATQDAPVATPPSSPTEMEI